MKYWVVHLNLDCFGDVSNITDLEILSNPCWSKNDRFDNPYIEFEPYGYNKALANGGKIVTSLKYVKSFSAYKTKGFRYLRVNLL